MSKTKYVLIAVLLLALAAAAGARGLLASGPRAPVPAAGPQPGEPIEAEVVTLTPFGFEPRQILRPPGPFFILVQNQSGGPEVTFRLSRVRGERLQEVRLQPGRRRWEQRLALGPGEYVLTEAGHPEWACFITIEAH